MSDTHLFIASAAHARDLKSVSTDILNDIWRIYREATERSLDVTFQKASRSEPQSFSINHPENDKALRYE